MFKRYQDVDIDPFCDASTNLFRGDIIFKLFHNLESIVIDHHGFGYFKFSFAYLASMISEAHSLKRLTIKAYWMHELWYKNKEKLIWMFKRHQFAIQYKCPTMIIVRK